MYEDKFKQIIDDIYQLIDAANPDPTYVSCHLEVEGIDFTLAHSTDDDDKIISFCDYGTPPMERRAEILTRLLEANMLSYDSRSPHFAINPETGSVIFIMQIPLENLTAQGVIDILTVQAMGAGTWGVTYFLEDIEQELAAAEME